MAEYVNQYKRYGTYRTLQMPGLKPSDYFLFKEEKDYFDFDMRQLVVLGLRLIYSGLHSKDIKEKILTLASQVRTEDLGHECADDVEGRVVYKFLKDIIPG